MANYKYIDLSSTNKTLAYKKQIIEFIAKENVDSSISTNFIKHMDFKFSNYLAFILISCKNDIIGFASVRRMAHWPKSIARIYNRIYISKKIRQIFRRKGLEDIKNPIKKYQRMTRPMYNMMMEKCKEHGIKIAVVTRENKGISNSIKTIHLKINAQDPYKKWKIYPDYLLTCNWPQNQKCWQRAIFRHININETEMYHNILKNIPYLSENEYKKKFCLL